MSRFEIFADAFAKTAGALVAVIVVIGGVFLTVSLVAAFIQ